MKIKLLTIIAVGFAFSYTTFAQKGGTTSKKTISKPEISFKIKGFNDQYLFLGYNYGNSKLKLDSVEQKKGVYTFSRDSSYLEGLYFIYTAGGTLLCDFFMDYKQRFSIELDTAEEGKIIAKGSPDNEIYYAYKEQRNELFKKGNAIFDKMGNEKDDEKKQQYNDELKDIQHTLDKINTDFVQQHPNHLLSKMLMTSKPIDVPDAPATIPDSLKQLWQYNYYKLHYFDNIDFSDNRLVYTPSYDDGSRFNTYFDKVLSQQPDTLIKYAIMLIDKTKASQELFKYTLGTIANKYGQSEVMGMENVWEVLADKYYVNDPEVNWVSDAFKENYKKRIARIKPTMIGSTPPELWFADTNVNKPNEGLYSIFTPLTKYTIVIFWEPSCGHCKKEMPKLKEFYLNHGKELDVEIVTVTTEPDIEKWKEYLQANQLPFLNLYGYKANRADWKDVYDISSTPVLLLFDRNHKIIAKRIGAEQLYDFIKWYDSQNH